jgi:creatinine amidohydrolase/Fe(II)-dependent formamide hydrolase-like protein
VERRGLRFVKVIALVALVQGCAPSPTPASTPPAEAAAHASRSADSVFLEDLTWTELRDAIKAGKTTILAPVGGVEQSGPYVALGKHDARVKVLAERIARNLGDALVAPVVAYVPEGNIDPPTEHMRFPGTITVPPEVFRQTLEWAAMSFRLHGFTDVVFIGDHGGYQDDLKAVADDLNRRWAGSPARAHFIAQYYLATQTRYVAALKQRGHSDAEIGTHAGLADTSLLLATAPAMVRADRLGQGAPPGPVQGVHGDPSHASAALGQLGVDAIVAETTAAIRAATRQH